MKKIYFVPIVLVLIIIGVMTWLYMSMPTLAQSMESKLTQTVAQKGLTARQQALLTAPALSSDVVIDRLVVHKSLREMQAFQGDTLIKTYPIALGRNPIGHKEFEGDGRTPEGIYTINDRNPNSAYHKNLGVSYPNAADIAHAQAHGKSAGGDIKIHGIKNGLGDKIGAAHLLKDWTEGCIAVTDGEMDELFRAVKDGAVIEIRA